MNYGPQGNQGIPGLLGSPGTVLILGSSCPQGSIGPQGPIGMYTFFEVRYVTSFLRAVFKKDRWDVIRWDSYDAAGKYKFNDHLMSSFDTEIEAKGYAMLRQLEQ
jgi:hypothetical protein